MASVLRQRQLKLLNLKALSGLQCNFLSRISRTYLWRNVGKQRRSNFSVVLSIMIFSTNYSPSCSTFADRRKNIPLLKRKGFSRVNRKKFYACKRALKESFLEKVILQKLVHKTHIWSQFLSSPISPDKKYASWEPFSGSPFLSRDVILEMTKLTRLYLHSA